MTSSNGNIFRVTGPLCGEFTGPGEFPAQRPVTRSVGVFFDLRLNKRLSKQSWGWWYETPPWLLWRQCYDICRFIGSDWSYRNVNDAHIYIMTSDNPFVPMHHVYPELEADRWQLSLTKYNVNDTWRKGSWHQTVKMKFCRYEWRECGSWFVYCLLCHLSMLGLKLNHVSKRAPWY